jgi:anti-sigma regulatory factor (Ser/Thr protein kinase)
MEVLLKKRYPARLEYLQQFMEAISDCAKEQGFNQKRISEIELAAEEALVNIFNYAYQGNEGDVEVICKLDPQDRLIIEILDSGVPFDMLSLGEPDTTADISERKVGGLGIFLIRKLMDDVQYQHEGTKNVLSLIVNKSKGRE